MNQTQAREVKPHNVLIIDNVLYWVARIEPLHILEWGKQTPQPQIIKMELLHIKWELSNPLQVLNIFRGWHEFMNIVSTVDRETFYKSVGYDGA